MPVWAIGKPTKLIVNAGSIPATGLKDLINRYRNDSQIRSARNN